jgi:hypothetical protein
MSELANLLLSNLDLKRKQFSKKVPGKSFSIHLTSRKNESLNCA